MSITIDATVSLPDIIRAAVHRRIQVLTEDCRAAEAAWKTAHSDAESAWQRAYELMVGCGDDCHIPRSIAHMVVALNEADISFTVGWVFGESEDGKGMPEVVSIEAFRSSRERRTCGLQRDLEISYRLGPVTDEVRDLILAHREATRAEERAEQRYNALRANLANPRMAQEMEGEMLASMIEAQAPEIHARIEALATGRPMIVDGTPS